MRGLGPPWRIQAIVTPPHSQNLARCAVICLVLVFLHVDLQLVSLRRFVSALQSVSRSGCDLLVYWISLSYNHLILSPFVCHPVDPSSVYKNYGDSSAAHSGNTWLKCNSVLHGRRTGGIALIYVVWSCICSHFGPLIWKSYLYCTSHSWLRESMDAAMASRK